MAHIANRSRFRVTVKNKPDVTRHFSFDKLDAVEAYMKELRARSLKPKVVQLDESWLVRIRDKGHKPLETTFGSEAAAIQFIDKTTEERKRGLFIDYTAALKVTFADLIVRFLRERAWKKKSGKVTAYCLEGWLEDSGPHGVELLARYREQLRTEGRDVRVPKFKMRQSSDELAWIHKRLAEVTTTDIEGFINDRLEVVVPSTVGRDIDRLKAVFKVALTAWDYHLAKNPMDAVERPEFFNERERRISKVEETGLLAALAQLDFERAVEAKLCELADDALAGQVFSSNSARKKVLAQVRAELRPQAEEEAEVQPYLQAFYLFQVMTAARRGESIGLTWDRVDFQAKTAFLPETKNGRARKLALRSDLLDALKQLPRDTEQVFAVGLDYIVDAWNKACAMAGIEDLRIHDCRHEALSRLAESGKFTIPELQVFSGHRDLRMLMRYAHLCASKLASKLDECFKDEAKVRIHRGRKLLNKHADVKLADVLAESRPQTVEVDGVTLVTSEPVSEASAAKPGRRAAQSAVKPAATTIATPSVGSRTRQPVQKANQLRGWRWARRQPGAAMR
jgi:integrase